MFLSGDHNITQRRPGCDRSRSSIITKKTQLEHQKSTLRIQMRKYDNVGHISKLFFRRWFDETSYIK